MLIIRERIIVVILVNLYTMIIMIVLKLLKVYLTVIDKYLEVLIMRRMLSSNAL